MDGYWERYPHVMRLATYCVIWGLALALAYALTHGGGRC